MALTIRKREALCDTPGDHLDHLLYEATLSWMKGAIDYGQRMAIMDAYPEFMDLMGEIREVVLERDDYV